MDIHQNARKFTDRNLARRIADQHVKAHKSEGVTCKILNVPNSVMFLYIARFNKKGQIIGVIS